MSRLLRILLQSLNHGRSTQRLDWTARDYYLSQQLTNRSWYNTSQQWCSDSSGPWDPRVREGRKNDSDDPKPMTKSHISPSSSTQSPYYHPALTGPDLSDDYASVSTQTDDMLGGDEKEYERDNLVAADRGTVVEKGKYRSGGLTVGGGGSVDRRKYGRNLAQSLESDDREDYDRNFAAVERSTVERRYGRDSSTPGEQGTSNEGEYKRYSLRSGNRNVEKREYSYSDFDISLQGNVNERKYDRDILISTNQEYGRDSLVTGERDADSLAIPDSDRDILLPSEVEKWRSRLLRNRIKECHDVKEVFALHRKHRAIMGVHHVLLVLEMLAGFVSDRIESAEKIRNCDEFRDVGHHLYGVVRRLLADDVAATLKHLCRLKVPADSKLVQVVLQVLRHQINDLDLKSLVFVEFLLRKLWPSTPLSEALLTAMPLLLDTKLSLHELHAVTILELSKLLSIGAGNVNKKSRHGALLVQELWRRHREIRDGPLSRSIAWSLLDLTNTKLKRSLLTPDEKKDRDRLLMWCLETLSLDLHSLSHREFETFLARLSNAYVNYDRECYNELFLHEAAQHALNQSLGIKQVAFVMEKLYHMGFQSDGLCERLSSLGARHPEELGEARIPLLPVLESLATCTQPLPYLHNLLHTIMTAWDATVSEENLHQKPVLRIALNLLSMQHCHPKLMHLLTNPDTLSIYMSQFPHQHRNHLRLLEVVQALQTLPDPPPQAIPDAFLDPARRQLMEKPPTRSTLSVMLGKVVGEGCVISGVVTEGSVYIDHLLVMDQSGCPIPLMSPVQSEQNIKIESLGIPPDSTRLAIMDVGSGRSLRPTHQLHGITRLQKRVLELQGFHVLPFLQAAFYLVPADEKILYVVRELRRAGVVLDDIPWMVTIGSSNVVQPQVMS